MDTNRDSKEFWTFTPRTITKEFIDYCKAVALYILKINEKNNKSEKQNDEWIDKEKSD